MPSTPETLLAIIQARMSSRRFPGKVLAPFRGQPIIRHVVDAVRGAFPQIPLVVATSVDPTDDALVRYLAGAGLPCFRGPLADVFSRFRACLEAHPATWTLRICADSPVLPGAILRKVVGGLLDGPEPEADVVTTTQPRTFPVGQNAELVRTAALLAVDESALDDEDREHVTRYFYRHPERFRICNVVSENPELARLSYAVDTPEDLAHLETLAERGELS